MSKLRIMSTDAMADQKPKVPAGDLSAFLESHPPGSRALVLNIARARPSGGPQLVTPDIQLHCPSEKCGGIRIFECIEDSEYSITDKFEPRFLTYLCRNCKQSQRIYALAARIIVVGKALDGEVYKIGEIPPFGPPVPARVISLVGPERDLFLKGRGAENQGLGIGSFAYYRRVVDSQWRRLIEEIIRVAERVGAPDPMLAVLRQAATEDQFAKAVDMIKEGIPEMLKVNGHNPLTLLYRALSEGLHEQTDEDCLEIASSIRVVLTELAERIGQALKDERELKDAVSRLLSRKQPGET